MAAERQANIEHNVLELGSGGSTIFFSRRCKSVKSYESNPEWENKVRSAIPEPSNVTFVLGNEETLVEAIRKEPDEYYDWLIADIDSGGVGDKGHGYEFRLKMMHESVSKLKSGGYMVVDNYEERHLMTFDYKGWDVYTFDDMGYHGRGTRICVKK